MRAIILAAGRGYRLQQLPQEQLPKCLLKLGGQSLLERHLRMLAAAGVREVVLALGFRHELIEAQLRELDISRQFDIGIVLNERFTLGSVLTVHVARESLCRGGDVLLMDADVLYDERIMHALAAGAGPANRILIDREFEPGDEPVKVCVREGVPVELRKQLAPDLKYDTIGESVGFFRLDEACARRFAQIVQNYVDTDRAGMPHEEALRDLLLERSQSWDVTDVTGAPWIEIDFPQDVTRAAAEVLPQLQALGGVYA